MGIRMWWTRLVEALRRARGSRESRSAPERTRAEQDSDREAHRQAGMSAEDREWEQASLQRNRDRQARAEQAKERESR